MQVTHSFGYVDPNRVQVDPVYQRTYRKKRKMPNYLSNEFVLSVLPIILSRRGDTLWAIDGQHRVVEAREIGMERVPAYTIEGLTINQEALLFAAIQEGARRLQTDELFKALEAGEEPGTMALFRMFQEEGVTRRVGRLTAHDPYTTITNTGGVRWVVERYGLEHLRRAIRLLLGVWPHTPQLLVGQHVKAAAILLSRMESYSPSVTADEVVRALAGVSLEEMRKEAEQRRTGGVHKEHALVDVMEDWLRTYRMAKKQRSKKAS